MANNDTSNNVKKFFAEHKAIIRILIDFIMILIASFLMIKYNESIATETSIDSLLKWFTYAFKYVPLMIVSSLSGIASGIICVIFLFVSKTITESSFAFLSAIYLGAAIVTYEITKYKWFRSLKKTILGIIVLSINLGCVWGVMLGIIAGRGFSEFTPYKMFFYFLNELLECTLVMVILYLF